MELALSSTAKAKIAAAALTAATLIGGAFSANAQQMARTSELDYSACDRMSATEPARAIQCRVDVIRASSAAARQRVQAANTEEQCAEQIKSQLASGRVTADAVRTTLAGRRTRDVGACNLLGMLTRS